MSKNVQTFIKSVLQSYQCTLKMHWNLTFLSWWKRPWKNWSTYKGKSIFVKSRISDNHKLSSGWMPSHVSRNMGTTSGRISVEKNFFENANSYRNGKLKFWACINSFILWSTINSPIFELFLEFRSTAAKIF